MKKETQNLNKSIENLAIEKMVEQFKEDLEFAMDCVRGMNAATIFFEDFESYEKLKEHSARINKILIDEIGFNVDKADGFLVKKYSINGTPSTAGEGEIKVSVFKTNDPKVFIGKYEYANGDVVWSVRPEEVEE